MRTPCRAGSRLRSGSLHNVFPELLDIHCHSFDLQSLGIADIFVGPMCWVRTVRCTQQVQHELQHTQKPRQGRKHGSLTPPPGCQVMAFLSSTDPNIMGYPKQTRGYAPKSSSANRYNGWFGVSRGGGGGSHLSSDEGWGSGFVVCVWVV